MSTHWGLDGEPAPPCAAELACIEVARLHKPQPVGSDGAGREGFRCPVCSELTRVEWPCPTVRLLPEVTVCPSLGDFHAGVEVVHARGSAPENVFRFVHPSELSARVSARANAELFGFGESARAFLAGDGSWVSEIDVTGLLCEREQEAAAGSGV